MHIQMLRNGAIDALEKAKTSLVSMPGLTVGGHGSTSDVEGRKQDWLPIADNRDAECSRADMWPKNHAAPDLTINAVALSCIPDSGGSD
jgi:hypothetical protein